MKEKLHHFKTDIECYRIINLLNSSYKDLHFEYVFNCNAKTKVGLKVRNIKQIKNLDAYKMFPKTYGFFTIIEPTEKNKFYNILRKFSNFINQPTKKKNK